MSQMTRYKGATARIDERKGGNFQRQTLDAWPCHPWVALHRTRRCDFRFLKEKRERTSAHRWVGRRCSRNRIL